MAVAEIVPRAAGGQFKQRENSHLGPPVRLLDKAVFGAQFKVAQPVMPGSFRRRIVSQGGDQMKLQVRNSSIVDFKMRRGAGPIAPEF